MEKFKVTVYKKILAWEKTTYMVDANSKDEAAEKGLEISNGESEAEQLDWEVIADTIRYEIDKFDIADISYEIAIDGEMMLGGGKFCDSKLQRAVDRI